MWGTRKLAWVRGREALVVSRLLGLLGLLGCVLVLTAVRPAPARAATGNPIGAHSMLQLNSPYSFMQAMFSQAAAMHASAIRLDVAPALIFPSEDGAADFSGLDEVMALAQQYHLRVLADLFTIPPWLAGCPATDTTARSRCPPSDDTEYGSLITQIVRHADPVIRDWEIWNEPDTSEFFSGTPAQYAFMLRTAHDAIKGVDPNANVLLGGISSPSGMTWLSQVLATPGADAVGAFDIANIHERGWLDSLVGEFVGWRWFLDAHGFSGPIWVTEHGYPADPTYQYDPHFQSGDASQASYLAASIPSLVDAGAAEVFVTERDNLSGQFASEGLLGGDVSDPPVDDPQVVQRPAFALVTHLADCYTLLGRDCPTGPPVASPAKIQLAPVRLGHLAQTTISITDPGAGPLMLGQVSLAGSPSFEIERDGCPAVLEPDQSCAVTVRYAPASAGAALASLTVPSDQGAVSVSLGAVATSVSALSSPQLPRPRFALGAGDGRVGAVQRLELTFTNRLPATVEAGAAGLSGPDAARFQLLSNSCRGRHLAPGARCEITVSFVPDRPGVADAILGLTGDGLPLTVPLLGTASPPPAVELLDPAPAAPACGPATVQVLTSQPAVIGWSAERTSPAVSARCRSPRLAGGALTGTGGRAWSARRIREERGHRGYMTTVRLPAGLAPGVYRVRITPTNGHGAGTTRRISVTVT